MNKEDARRLTAEKNTALDIYRRLRALLDRGRVVNAPYTSSVLVEFKESRDAAMLADLLQQFKAEAKAERKAEMLAHGVGS